MLPVLPKFSSSACIRAGAFGWTAIYVRKQQERCGEGHIHQTAPVGENDGGPDAVGSPAAALIMSLQPDVITSAAAIPPGMCLGYPLLCSMQHARCVHHPWACAADQLIHLLMLNVAVAD